MFKGAPTLSPVMLSIWHVQIKLVVRVAILALRWHWMLRKLSAQLITELLLWLRVAEDIKYIYV